MPSYSKQLNTLINIIEALREAHSEMPMQTAHCLLCVAIRPGLTMQELGAMTNLSQSATSRNMQLLGEWARPTKPGLRLVEALDDSIDTRRKIMFLTPKGKALMEKILSTLMGEPVLDFDHPEGRRVVMERRRVVS